MFSQPSSSSFSAGRAWSHVLSWSFVTPRSMRAFGPAVHLREPHPVVAHFLLRHRPPVAENGRVEVEGQHPVNRREKLDRAAAAGVIDDGNGVDDDVARVDRLQVRETR